MTEAPRMPQESEHMWRALEPLQELLPSLIKSTNQKRARAQKRSAWLFVGQAVLMALTTVLVSVAKVGDFDLAPLAVVASSTAALLATIQGHFKDSDRWRHFTMQVHGFYGVQAELDRIKAFALQFDNGQISRERVENIYSRLDDVLGQSIDRWSKIAESTTAQPSPPIPAPPKLP